MREPLRTNRLLLRDITERDAELLFELDSDPEVIRYVGSSPASEVGWYRDRIRTAYLSYQTHPWRGVWLVLDAAREEFLGWVFVRPAPKSMLAREMGWTAAGEEELGFRYRRASWGRGIATEAARPLVELALADPATTALVACAHASNLGSLRVLEKLDFERVGEVTLPDVKEPVVKLARANAHPRR